MGETGCARSSTKNKTKRVRGRLLFTTLAAYRHAFTARTSIASPGLIGLDPRFHRFSGLVGIQVRILYVVALPCHTHDMVPCCSYPCVRIKRNRPTQTLRVHSECDVPAELERRFGTQGGVKIRHRKLYTSMYSTTSSQMTFCGFKFEVQIMCDTLLLYSVLMLLK